VSECCAVDKKQDELRREIARLRQDIRLLSRAACRGLDHNHLTYSSQVYDQADDDYDVGRRFPDWSDRHTPADCIDHRRRCASPGKLLLSNF